MIISTNFNGNAESKILRYENSNCVEHTINLKICVTVPTTFAPCYILKTKELSNLFGAENILPNVHAHKAA